MIPRWIPRRIPRRIPRLLAPLLALLGAPLAGAAPLTLEEARSIAVEQAIAVERASAARDAARADAWSATAGALPAVTGFASANTGAGFTPFGFERPVATQYGVGARGSWALLAPSDWAAARAARRGLDGQEAMVRWAMVEARRDVTAAYAAALGAAGQRDAMTRAAADAARSADAVASLSDAGIRPRADAALARADAAALEADRLAAEWSVDARCAELMALLRQDVSQPCELAPASWEPPGHGPSAHPALEAARAALAQAGALRGQSISALLPSVDATGTAAWYATDAGSVGAGWSAGLELTAPVLASGAGRAGVQAADAGERIAALELEDQERALRAALFGSEARHTAAISALAARREALDAAEGALDRVDEAYRSGFADLTDLLTARRARDTAAVALALADTELGAALAELEAARGVW